MTLRLFGTWQDQSLDGIFAECRELAEDASFPTVRRWRETGGKVLGHFQVYFPEEIAHAAGMLPLKMRGAPVEPTHSDSRFGSYICSILKTSLELVLSNSVELDMFVTHPICDAARNLAAVWGRNFSYPCQILYLPQNANSGASAEYLRGEYERVKHDIEAVAGIKVTDEAVRNSLTVYNENRSLLRKMYEIKRKQPWLLSGFEAYLLMTVGGMITREEHNEMLKAAIPLIEARPAKRQDKIRVVFEGGFCEQPPLDLIRAISQSCYIVDDDLLIGLRWLTEDVPTDGDPLAHLATAYIERSSYSPVQHDLRKPKEKMLLERIRAARAEAAIVAAAKMCEPGLEEQVAYAALLDKENIPYFLTEFEENMTSFEGLELQVETFLENLLFA